jgi:hypothetical protein
MFFHSLTLAVSLNNYMAKYTILEKKAYKYALRLQMRGYHPAAIIAAGKSYYKKVGRSRPPSPHINSDKLRMKLSTLGQIYTQVNGNFLGCCAEVDAADYIMTKLRHLDPNQVDFSNARRPRTMQIIPPCKNCKSTFSI